MATSATTSTSLNVNDERRKRVLLGDLPDDFLRLDASRSTQVAVDHETAAALQSQLNTPVYQAALGRLNITVDKAKLVKNYGFARMDPYVRLRVGHCVYETHTDTNGGKMPRWNKVVQCLIPPGVRFINIEIYDERSFTMDEMIAWAQIPIPPTVFEGETHEEWFPLSGKQGEGQEGVINLVLSYVPNAFQCPQPVQPVMMVPRTGGSLLGLPATTYAPVPVVTQPTPPPTVVSSPVDLKLVEEMFPNIDKDVIKSVYDANRGDKDAVINSLLQISQ